MRAVDTNVLVRLLTRDDAKQVSVAERFVANGAWVSHVVLVETLWVLASVYELEPTRIAVAVEMLLDHASLTLQDSESVEGALREFRGTPSLGFSDCLAVELARKAGQLPLGTFDRQLAKLTGTQRLAQK